MRSKLSDTEFIQAVECSISIAEVLRKIGLVAAGGNYKTVHKRIVALNLDTSHFKGQGHNRGKVFGPRRPLEEYLSNRFPIKSDDLRRRLIREGLKEARCESCRLSEWNGQPITLELEHIDGDHYNNNIENLQVLCPNCHSQTPTWRGRNVGKRV